MRLDLLVKTEIFEGKFLSFTIGESERMKYRTFREKHTNLERIIKGMNVQERMKREQEIQALFIDLVNSYVEESGLESTKCFAYYGNDKKTLVKTPSYTLFENNDPFDVMLEVTYWFSTNDETLSCTSNLSYQSGLQSSERNVLYDLLKRIVEKESKMDIISHGLF
mgnify:CR=1 FL=1